jgi:hypothetical protein
MKRVFFLAIALFITMSGHSQKILTDISKYNLDKIESRTIIKSRKLLKMPMEQRLFIFTYYAVGLSDYFYQETGNVDDFLKHFSLCDKYRCYVYDSSLNILTMAIGKNVFPYFSTTPDSLYIEYIERINPEYVFEYIYAPTRYTMFFCYKDGEITIVHLSDNGNDIVSYSLSELKDWKWLNIVKVDQ